MFANKELVNHLFLTIFKIGVMLGDIKDMKNLITFLFDENKDSVTQLRRPFKSIVISCRFPRE